MHSFMDAKLMAKLLRQALAERDITITHSESLELVARQFGVANWNILSARIEVISAAEPALKMPPGWKDGNGRSRAFYRMGLDPDHANCAIISSTAIAAGLVEHEFGTMCQTIGADAYQGGAIRVSCELSSDGVDGAGTVWLRVDGPAGKVLRFNNLMDMKGVPLTGTRDWTEFAVTLDVPPEANSISYGFLLSGLGVLRAREFRVTPVDVALTSTSAGSQRRDSPHNLGFSGAPD